MKATTYMVLRQEDGRGRGVFVCEQHAKTLRQMGAHGNSKNMPDPAPNCELCISRATVAANEIAVGVYHG